MGYSHICDKGSTDIDDYIEYKNKIICKLLYHENEPMRCLKQHNVKACPENTIILDSKIVCALSLSGITKLNIHFLIESLPRQK